MPRDRTRLRNELRSKSFEAQILSLLNQAHHNLKHLQDLNKAWETIHKALDLLEADSPRTFYPKCVMMYGVIAHAQGETQSAATAFYEALPCLTIDPERQVLPYYLDLYQDTITFLIRSTERALEEVERDETIMDEAVAWAREHPRSHSLSAIPSIPPTPLQITRPQIQPPFTPSRLPAEPKSGRPFSARSRPFTEETSARSSYFNSLLEETKKDLRQLPSGIETQPTDALDALEGKVSVPASPDAIDKFINSRKNLPKVAASRVLPQDLIATTSTTPPGDIDQFVESRKTKGSRKRSFMSLTKDNTSSTIPSSPIHPPSKHIAHSPPSPSSPPGPKTPDQSIFSFEPEIYPKPKSLPAELLSAGELALSDTPIPSNTTPIKPFSDPTFEKPSSLAGRRHRTTPTHLNTKCASPNPRLMLGKFGPVLQVGDNVTKDEAGGVHEVGNPASPLTPSPLRKATLPGDSGVEVADRERGKQEQKIEDETEEVNTAGTDWTTY